MKKKSTDFPYARAQDSARAIASATERRGAYPSFREAIGTADLRALVQRAARRVLGPAALAGAVLTGCDAASDAYGDLLAPPQIERPIEMIEVSSAPVAPIAPATQVAPPTPQAIPPCDLEESATAPKIRHHPRLPGRPIAPNPRAIVRGEAPAVMP